MKKRYPLEIIPEQESIYSIVGRMDTLIENFNRNPPYRALLPFLETYYLVTRAVAESGLDPHHFDDKPALDVLDIHFANLYFKPLLAFLAQGDKQKPWKTYFEHCLSPASRPFVQMMLGINAHINCDLPCALAELGYKNKKDFLKINAILERTIPAIMNYLAFHEHDLLGAGGIVFKHFMTSEFNSIIVSWRLNAWKNAQKIKTESDKQKLIAETEKAAKRIVKIFDNLYHLTNVQQVIPELHKLQVKI